MISISAPHPGEPPASIHLQSQLIVSLRSLHHRSPRMLVVSHCPTEVCKTETNMFLGPLGRMFLYGSILHQEVARSDGVVDVVGVVQTEKEREAFAPGDARGIDDAS